MSAWLEVLLVIVAAFLARGLVFTYLLWRAKRLLALARRYWRDEANWSEVGQRKREVVRLFRVAQITEPAIEIVKPVGYGQIVRHTAGLFSNVFLRRDDVAQLVFDAFVEAQGYFKDEIRRSFIPIFWPSVVANLPADVLVYIGVTPTAAAVRVAKLVGAAVVFGASLVTIIAFFTR